LRAVLAANALDQYVDVVYLPARLHNHPEQIVPQVEALIGPAIDADRPVFVAYADCGTGGQLDAMFARYPDVRRLPGAHCYEFFAGHQRFAEFHEQAPGTFYLTDFLAKHFEALVWRGLGIDRAPQLRELYFRNYTRVMLLSQSNDSAVISAAIDAAARLGLTFVHQHVGRDGLGTPIHEWSVTVRKAAA
jgi:hypothetical protein